MSCPCRSLKILLFRLPVFLFLSFFTSELFAQNYYSRNFTMDDGLPSNTVRSVFKDSRRIMWIGTSAGLCRFTGREFKVYNSADGLGAENIFDIAEDGEGNLWIGAMAGGISKFDGKKFVNYTTRDGLVCNDVRKVWWSKKFHLLFIGTNRGCSVFDGKKFYSCSDKDIGSSSETWFVLGFVERADHVDVWAYGFSDVYYYYPSTHKFSPGRAGPYSLNSSSTSPLCLKNGDTVWSWARSGIKVWNRGLKKAFDSLGQVFHMAQDEGDNVWIAAWAEMPSGPGMPGGLYFYNGKTVKRLSEKAGITDVSVWTVFFDSVFHSIWVGTLHQGLYRIPMPVFEWFEPSFFGLSSLNLNDIYFDKNNTLWMASTRELIRLNKDKTFYRYPQKVIKAAQKKAFAKYYPEMFGYRNDKSGSFEKYRKLKSASEFRFPNPYTAVFTNFGTLKTTSPGSLYDPSLYRNEFKKSMKGFDDTTAVYYSAITADSRGKIYVSGGFGLNSFSLPGDMKIPEVIPVTGNLWVMGFDLRDSLYWSSYWDKGLSHIAMNPGVMYPDNSFYTPEKDNAPESPVRMIVRGNEVWCASRFSGINLTENGKSYAFCKQDSTLPKSFNDICFDGPLNIIAGANNGEIIIARVDGERLKILFRLGAKDGILGRSIRWLVTDKHRNLFIGTNMGLNLINLNELDSAGKARVRFYSKEAGFTNLNGKRAVVDPAGDIWVATDRNLCRVNFESLQQHPAHKIKMTITGLDINNIPVEKLDDYSTDKWFGFPDKSLTLSHSQNNLVFYFDALNYLDAEHQTFRYRLLPVIKGWSVYSTEHKAVFTTLRPNQYQLEIEAVNPLDQSQLSRTTYCFTIRPPVYFTWWFILVSLILVIGITAFIIHLRLLQVRKEEKQKADVRLELNNIELKALKAQMNPHFIFNAINAIQSFILSSNVDKALYYLSLFSRLVRKTLENASKEFIPLGEELEYLNYYIELEKMRFEGQFKIELEIDPELPLETTMIPPMIIQPFIENAIKHGLLRLDDVGTLKLSVNKINDNQYSFIVEDNGIGRARAEEFKKSEVKVHTSKGMEITNTRLRLLNENGRAGEYSVKITDLLSDDGKPAGTKIEVSFPLEG